MQNSSFTMIYKNKILQNNLIFDKTQYKAVTILNVVYKNLLTNQNMQFLSFKNLARILLKFIQNYINKEKSVTKGVYLWGDPGCGKTWLINLFFTTIAGNRKLRFHFYEFILYIQENMQRLQGNNDPLLIIAYQLKLKTDILFLDEFYISDITNAILISTLFIEIFKHNIILIITSNINPDALFQKFLNNDLFSNTIKKIRSNCHIVNINSGIDYRTQNYQSICLWKYPLNKETNNYMNTMFHTLSGTIFKQKSILRINHRNIIVLGSNNGVLSIDFDSICGEGRDQHDYVKLSSCFHSILVHNIPIMMNNNENKAKRFLLLVDELYEHNIKLIVSAETDKFSIYQGTELKFEYKRCLSRLQEMNSEKYFKLPNVLFCKK
ncbi:cell division protein ZapE [Candidatus Pantoea edessiphila]|uniref:Cell division protein ZapE n=1 Tax=Candidatus Pantoea edessiphila TaxID=2044610 RepID=A0A2P5SW19_9GAMM|nr:cell division protein ZapE [Candidatus Pantoea edessiphila]PPI86539.1 cell division protein ZapE [Candidatus Pantoea edessiphila]